MKVKPARAGLIVRFPEKPSRVLADEGEDVPRSTYWIRRLKAGDVVPVQAIKSEDKPVIPVKES